MLYYAELFSNVTVNPCSLTGNCLIYCLMSSKFQKEGMKHVRLVVGSIKSRLDKLCRIVCRACRAGGVGQEPDRNQQIEMNNLTSPS